MIVKKTIIPFYHPKFLKNERSMPDECGAQVNAYSLIRFWFRYMFILIKYA